MTVVVALLLSLGTHIFLTCLLALSVRAYLKGGSRATQSRKSPSSSEQTPPSVTDARVAQMEVDQASLFSTLEKLTTTVKRLSSRAGMQDVRARRATADDVPPEGAPKADLFRHYGMSGKVGPDFAREQLARERKEN